jgi:hypothetical protein
MRVMNFELTSDRFCLLLISDWVINKSDQAKLWQEETNDTSRQGAGHN